VPEEVQCAVCLTCYLDKKTMVSSQCQRLRKEKSGKDDEVQHFFCQECFYEWMNTKAAKSCPICREGGCDKFVTEISFDPNHGVKDKKEGQVSSDKADKVLSPKASQGASQGSSSSSGAGH